MAAPDPNELLTTLLRDVSRSFYKTLRLLPPKIRPQISLAYLLARTTDTIADTGLVPLEQRLEALRALSERIQGRNTARLNLGELASRQGSPAEKLLLEQTETSLSLLFTFSPGDLELVRKVLETITSGQELDLRRFAIATPGHVVALSNDDELDDYTYRVAGCVGEFWTRMCRTHLFPKAALDDPWLLANGVRFGKGLQLVNILRDLAADLAQGRCYLPAGRLAAAGLEAPDLLRPACEPRLRPIYNSYLDQAQAHLLAGWDYTQALPWRQVRVRLACALPILIGLRTLELLRSSPVLDPARRIKISRDEVKRIFSRSVLLYPYAAAWRKQAFAAAASASAASAFPQPAQDSPGP